MDGFLGFVKKLVDGFEKEGLDYAFTGALAASFYGVPRTTADVDVMIVVFPKDAKNKLISALRLAGLQVEATRIDDSLKSGYVMATFKCKTSPYKVDVILSDSIRKRPGTIRNLKTYFQLPEDLILAKLRMIRFTIPPERATKDEEDVRAILRFTDVDKAAIEKQTKKDGTLGIWKNFSEG